MTRARSFVSRWLAEPLLHFAAIGAAIFVLYASFARPSGDAAAGGDVVVTQGRIRSLVETFTRQWNRAPSDDEMAGLVRDFVREEVLAREAIALGLDRDDTIVRRRLAQKMEFLSDDLVAVGEPTDDDLRGFLAAHPDQFGVEPRFTFSQVFLDRGKRGDALDRDAAALLIMLNAPGAAADAGGRDLPALGDSRLLEPRFEDVARSDVAARLGAGFAARLETLPLGRFAGPIESGYGAHLVRMEQRTRGRVPSFDEVRDAVVRQWKDAKRREVKDAQWQALLARHRVTIEPDRTTSPERVAGTTP